MQEFWDSEILEVSWFNPYFVSPDLPSVELTVCHPEVKDWTPHTGHQLPHPAQEGRFDVRVLWCFYIPSLQYPCIYHTCNQVRNAVNKQPVFCLSRRLSCVTPWDELCTHSCSFVLLARSVTAFSPVPSGICPRWCSTHSSTIELQLLIWPLSCFDP